MLEHYWRDIIGRHRSDPIAQVVKGGLWIISLGYSAVTGIRNWAYDQGYFSHQHVQDATVVSIGNIVVGGTGKTPLILKLLEDLNGIQVAVLSRGYRSTAEKLEAPKVICEGTGPLFPSSYCGDESYLIAKRFPETFVVVGRNRCEAARMAVKAGRCLLLLDDGLQHRKLSRDIEIIVVDTEDPLGCGYLFPRGYLRESPEALRRADLIVAIGNQDVRNVMRRYTDAPMVRMTLEPQDNPFAGKKVGVFCGLAKPEKFLATVNAMNADVVDTLFSADHTAPSTETLVTFSNRCQQLGAEALLCTEKDAVKLHPFPKTSLSIHPVKAKLKINFGEQEWLSLLQRLQSTSLAHKSKT